MLIAGQKGAPLNHIAINHAINRTAQPHKHSQAHVYYSKHPCPTLFACGEAQEGVLDVCAGPPCAVAERPTHGPLVVLYPQMALYSAMDTSSLTAAQISAVCGSMVCMC